MHGADNRKFHATYLSSCDSRNFGKVPHAAPFSETGAFNAFYFFRNNLFFGRTWTDLLRVTAAPDYLTSIH